MPDMPTILELRSRTADGIYAVPYRSRRGRKPQRLSDGLIVESPTPDERRQAPACPAACFEVATGGGPATVHHANLGLVAGFLVFEGVYLLPSGDVAAVYGAEAVPLGVPRSGLSAK
jgi:hypothetical protein